MKKVFIKNFTNYNSGINLTTENSNKIRNLDRLIFAFVIIFLISLTNSIFFNQIGYFFALILMIVRWSITKESKFEKIGLEIPFILFLSAELISAVFSINQPQAFTIFFKRLVLIPVVYVIVAASDDMEKAKTFFKFYISSALLTTTVYIVVAYEHFISQLYQIESRGPSPFQYVMTAGGLMSFAVIFLFAFLLNEKTKLKFKAMIFTAFIFSFVALISSYTRAAWIGAAAGMFVVLLLTRKWIILTAGVILLITGIFLSKNVSKVFEYKIEDSGIEKVNEFTTDGRASDVLSINDTLLIADYENGISVRIGDKEIQKITTIAPVSGIKKWKDNYYIGFLVDSRVMLIKKDSVENYTVVDEFISPGRTVGYEIFNNYLYMQDVDSGLTIFKDPENLKSKITLPQFSGMKNVSVDSSLFAGFDPIKNALYVYSVKGGIPTERIDSVRIKSGFGFIWINNNAIYFQNEIEFGKYTIQNSKIVKTAFADLRNIVDLFFDETKIIACAINGYIYELKNDSNSKINFEIVGTVGFSPRDYYKDGDKLYASQIKRNRITSIADPYHDTNLERLAQWRTGWKILIAHPLFGVGDIDLKDVYAEYKDYYLKENFGHLHNNYVHFLVILGFVGFICVMFMLYKIFTLDLKIYRAVKNIPFVSSYSLGALAAFVGFLVSGLAEWNFGDQEIITMVWFILGLNIAFYKNVLKNKLVDSK